MSKSFSSYVKQLCTEVNIENPYDKIDLIPLLVKESIKDGVKYDFDYKDDSLISIYKGSRDFPTATARTICKHFDEDKLYRFIWGGIESRNRIMLQGNSDLVVTYQALAKERVREFKEIIYNISYCDKRYINAFFKDLKKYNVEIFIEKCDPSCGISFEHIDMCDEFVKHIKKYYSRNITTTAPEELAEKYLEYAEVLDEYIIYLGLNMVPLADRKNCIFDSKGDVIWFDNKSYKEDSGTASSKEGDASPSDDQWFVPKYIPGDYKWGYNFKNTVTDFRNKLCEIYCEINSILDEIGYCHNK